MKKIVAIASFFLFILGQSRAQDGDLRLGFQVSPMLSNMKVVDENTIITNGTNLGLKLGMCAEFFFRENYAFIAGLGFSFNSGGTLHYENTGRPWQKSDLPPEVLAVFPNGQFLGSTDLKYSLQYVEIPFGLKFRTREFGYMRYFMELPVFTLGFRSQSRGAVEFTNVNEDKIDIKKEVNPLALSWGLCGGVEYSISDGTALIAGLGYQRVFTDVTKDYDPNDNAKGVINNFVLRLGVMF